MKLTKEEVLRRVTQSLVVEDKPIEWSFDLLRFPFGFKRVSTEVALFGYLFGKSEEDLSYSPKDEIISNVLKWAEENGFACCYNGNYTLRDTFTFYGLIKPTI